MASINRRAFGDRPAFDLRGLFAPCAAGLGKLVFFSPPWRYHRISVLIFLVVSCSICFKKRMASSGGAMRCNPLSDTYLPSFRALLPRGRTLTVSSVIYTPHPMRTGTLQ